MSPLRTRFISFYRLWQLLALSALWIHTYVMVINMLAIPTLLRPGEEKNRAELGDVFLGMIHWLKLVSR